MKGPFVNMYIWARVIRAMDCFARKRRFFSCQFIGEKKGMGASIFAFRRIVWQQLRRTA